MVISFVIDLFHGQQLSRVKVHPHINPTERTAAYQLALAPPDRWCAVFWNRRQCLDRWFRKQPDSGFPDARADLLDQATAEASVVPSWRSERHGSANRSENVLHWFELLWFLRFSGVRGGVVVRTEILGFSNVHFSVRVREWERQTDRQRRSGNLKGGKRAGRICFQKIK